MSSSTSPELDAASTQVEQAPEEAPSAFELTLLLPTQSFVTLPKTATPNADGYLELPLPSQHSDAVHDLKNIITESPEGFWYGAFGLKPIVSEEIVDAVSQEVVVATDETEQQPKEKKWGPWTDLVAPAPESSEGPLDPKMWRLTTEGVLGDFSDLSGVFSGEWQGKRRGLKVVPTSYSPLAMSTHLLRVRDTLFSNLAGIASSATYDPTSLSISAGSTIFQQIRGELPEEPVVVEESEEAQKGSKGKKSKASKKPAAPAASEPVEATTEAAPAPQKDGKHPFTDFKVEDLSPSAFLEYLRPASATSLASPCIKSLGVSAWSPPPHARRMRGDIVYLTITTLEGESYHVTGATAGFWISKTTTSHFDPLPRAVLPKGVRAGPYQGLFELLADLSPLFAKSLSTLVQAQHRQPSSPDIYAAIPITHVIPAASWVVAPPQHAADPFRTQLAYLVTSSTSAELLPPARDWNDEFAQYRELPQSTVPERLLRERLLARVHADFVSAATKGALGIARGDVPPLNPNEALEAHTYIHNNMLFTKAEDAVGVYAHMGGDEASKYAAAKDLQGVSLLERIDVDDVHTMATVLVDFAGERWVVQSLIPGLFKTKELDDDVVKVDGETRVYPAGDADAQKAAKDAVEQDKPFPSEVTPNKDDYPPTGAFRIVYGSANPESPDEKVRASAYFHQLAKKVASNMRFAEHSVFDADKKQQKLFTSTDMHGIAAPDGRSYFIDCFRMQCVDVEFVEQNIEGPIFSDASSTQTNGVHTPAPYPHRLALLRPELLELYRDSKFKKWLEERVEETRDRVAKESGDDKAIEPAPGSIESELKDAASEEQPAATGEEKKAAGVPQTVINAEDFVLNFNPDAFVERKAAKDGEAAAVPFDASEESSQAVREASRYLRETSLKSFILDVVSNSTVVTDGFFLSKLVHRKGINLRYLGMLADKIDSEGASLDFGAQITKEESTLALKVLKHVIQLEMIIRASKHIINRLLRAAVPYDHPSIIAHFFNCLLGASLQASPIAELVPLPAGVAASREWAKLTPASVQSQLISEVEARFRYALSPDFFANALLPHKLLREISLRVGVQFVAREYRFTSPDGTAASEPVEEEKKVVSEPSKKKKGKASKDAPKAEEQLLSFHAEDVLNIAPVVKATHLRSLLADENFSAGQRAIGDGHIEVGQEQIQDAMQLNEQVFGGIHSDASSKYHQLGILYHTLHQTIQRKVSLHDLAESTLAEPETREEAKEKLLPLLLENIDAARAEADSYLQLAVRSIRQSVIICERANGLDGYETIQQYSDLGLLEQASGNAELGLKLTKHAMLLWSVSYGRDHPSMHTLVSNAAAMVQAEHGTLAGVPLILEQRALSERLWGRDSLNYAFAENALAQAYATVGDYAASLTHMRETLRIFTIHLAADSKEVTEATTFVHILEGQVDREEAESKAREERLKKKFPIASTVRGVPQRVGGTAPSTAGATAGAPPAIPVADIPKIKAHGQKANLSVDELVNFIQGTKASTAGSSSKASRKRKASPPSATKA